jgi:hypothetical protein
MKGFSRWVFFKIGSRTFYLGWLWTAIRSSWSLPPE